MLVRDPARLTALAAQVIARADARGIRLATVESCTGGLVSAVLTAIPGSSSVVERAFVTYSNDAKSDLVGVRPALIHAHGAVSAEVAAAMAEGALAACPIALAVSITGIAGPGGATDSKPVGLVFIGLARSGAATRVERHVFPGDRTDVREASTRRALELLLDPGLTTPESGRA